jgi:hypothetical protein
MRDLEGLSVEVQWCRETAHGSYAYCIGCIWSTSRPTFSAAAV